VDRGRDHVQSRPATVGYIPPTSAQHWFSLLNPDKSPRQAFIAIRDARQSGTLP
jgi:hypothetical protein